MTDSDHLEKLKQQILEIVDGNKAGIAYSKLMMIDDFRGACRLAHPRFPMVRYWEGLSEPAAEAILELAKAGVIRHEPTDTLAYVAQGPSLDYPIFTFELMSRAGELNSPHWMPVLLLKND